MYIHVVPVVVKLSHKRGADSTNKIEDVMILLSDTCWLQDDMDDPLSLILWGFTRRLYCGALPGWICAYSRLKNSWCCQFLRTHQHIRRLALSNSWKEPNCYTTSGRARRTKWPKSSPNWFKAYAEGGYAEFSGLRLC